VSSWVLKGRLIHAAVGSSVGGLFADKAFRVGGVGSIERLARFAWVIRAVP
jgi:hypothetical protein